MVDEEIFFPVVGYENSYHVSNFGRIKSLPKQGNAFKERILKEFILDKKGYKGVKLIDKTILVHRIVAKNFIENPENKSQVNHKNGNKNDNTVGNLEWVTGSENVRHAYETGLTKIKYGEQSFNSRFTNEQVLDIFTSTLSTKDLIIKYNTGAYQICNIRTGKTWGHLTGKKYERRYKIYGKSL